MRRLAPALLLVTMFISACSDSSSPTAPVATPVTPEASLGTLPGCPTDAQIRAQIDALFEGRIEVGAQARYAAIRIAMAANKTALAQQLMYNTVDWTLAQYSQGNLIGGKSAATQARVTTFINSLYCAVGLPAPTIPPGALGPDGAIAIVSPATTTTNVVTDTKTAGIQLPANGVTTPTLITVSRIPGHLLTQLDQYPLYYEFHASPALPGNVDAVVGVCIANDLTPPDPSRLRVAHNVPDPNPTTIEILPLAPAPFLDCTNALSVGLGPNPSLRELASYGLARAGHALRALLSPTPAFASYVGTTGLGGTTKQLSPFGVVDTLITVSAVSPTTISGIAGAAVPSSGLPSVRVATPTNQPVTNYPVTFTVPSGSEGAISGGAATTNASGVATIGGWTLGATLGTDLVNAAVAPPHLGSGVQGSPVNFSATVISATPVTYKSAGYLYSLIGDNLPPSGWETVSYTGGSAWPTGAAGFGMNFAADGCSIVSDIQTGWPGASTVSSAGSPSNTSDLLLRKSVTVPSGWTGSLSIAVAIDNDVQVFVNGVDVTASGGATVGGFAAHEGCATRGSLVFTAANGILLPGANNLVAVHARDRGRTSYFDMEVTLVP